MTRKAATATADGHPDFTRPDAALVRIREWTVAGPEEQSAKAAALVEEWDGQPWPDELLSRSLFAGAGHDALLSYEQWDDESAVPADSKARSFHRRLSLIADNERRVPGIIAYAEIDVDDTDSAQGLLDAVTQALAADPERDHPWGISANFHISADGGRMVNLSEWTSEEHHQQGVTDTSRSHRPAWRRITTLPGVRPIGVRRFRLCSHQLPRTLLDSTGGAHLRNAGTSAARSSVASPGDQF
ncbi:hypothetical protein [Streptomyces sp. Je 1-332]|uniref:hypothetical protein n=1 Tax=Streptomyces sp. Je 1-332 TaxID=3231270 RepID=UPI00345B139A